MNTSLSFTDPAQLDTECLAVVVLDHGSADKPEPKLASTGAALAAAAADVLSSGEVSGKAFETSMLHRPAGLKARR